MPFQITALPYASFAPLFAMDDAALLHHRARRVTAGEGSPCRVSLQDAAPGETLLLVNHTHQPADTPFHASHAIFVREGAKQARPARGEVPDQLRARTLSMRAFDADGMIVDCRLADGRDCDGPLTALLALPGVDHVDLDYAAYGCFAARATAA